MDKLDAPLVCNVRQGVHDLPVRHTRRRDKVEGHRLAVREKLHTRVGSADVGTDNVRRRKGAVHTQLLSVAAIVGYVDLSEETGIFQGDIVGRQRGIHINRTPIVNLRIAIGENAGH